MIKFTTRSFDDTHHNLRILCALGVSIFPFFSLSSPPAAPAAAPAAAEQPAWNPVFKTFDGRELRPATNSQATVLVFLLKDCPIANSFIPELNRLDEEFRPRGVSLLLIHADSQVTPDEARAHATEYQIKLPVTLDPNHHWVKTAAATTSPEAVVFSKTGQIVYRGRINDQYVGLGKRRAVVTSHDLKSALEAILANQPIPQPKTEPIGCPIPILSK
jgi:hypothetical protein